MRAATKDMLVDRARSRFEGQFVTIAALSTQSGLGWMDTRRAVRRLNLAFTKKEQLLHLSYLQAIDACARNDKFGVADYRGIAQERGVRAETVAHFFERNPDLKRKWNVFDAFEAKKERCRRAAARIRNGDPNKPVRRKELAIELDCGEDVMRQYLISHPDLVVELRIEYTREGDRRRLSKVAERSIDASN